MRIPLIFRGIRKGITVHLFAYRLLHNATGNLHEVALRGWAFRHGLPSSQNLTIWLYLCKSY
jgi:hypothetical protein